MTLHNEGSHVQLTNVNSCTLTNPSPVQSNHSGFLISLDPSIYHHLDQHVIHLVFVAAFYRQSRGWTLLFQKTWNVRPFSCQNSNPLLEFSLQHKEG